MVFWNPDRDYIHEYLKSDHDPSSPLGKQQPRVRRARRIWAAVQGLFKKP